MSASSSGSTNSSTQKWPNPRIGDGVPAGVRAGVRGLGDMRPLRRHHAISALLLAGLFVLVASGLGVLAATGLFIGGLAGFAGFAFLKVKRLISRFSRLKA